MENSKKIHALNEVQRLINLQVNHILPQLNKYKGQKIFLADGSKSAKFKINFLEIEPEKYNNEYANVHWVSIKNSGSCLWLELSLCFKNDDCTCFYEKESIYIGTLESYNFKTTGILKDVIAEAPEMIQYNLQEQLDLLKEKNIIEERLREIKYDLVIS